MCYVCYDCKCSGEITATEYRRDTIDEIMKSLSVSNSVYQIKRWAAVLLPNEKKEIARRRREKSRYAAIVAVSPVRSMKVSFSNVLSIGNNVNCRMSNAAWSSSTVASSPVLRYEQTSLVFPESSLEGSGPLVVAFSVTDGLSSARDPLSARLSIRIPAYPLPSR